MFALILSDFAVAYNTGAVLYIQRMGEGEAALLWSW